MRLPAVSNKSNKTNSEKKNSLFFFFFFFYIGLQKQHNSLMYWLHVLRPEDDYYTCQLSRIRHRSPALPYRSPYLPDKIIFWAFLCLGLKFSPFLAQNVNFSYSQYGFWAFLHVFSHWQRLFLGWKRWLRFLIVRTSCKTSFDVLSHSQWEEKRVFRF